MEEEDRIEEIRQSGHLSVDERRRILAEIARDTDAAPQARTRAALVDDELVRSAGGGAIGPPEPMTVEARINHVMLVIEAAGEEIVAEAIQRYARGERCEPRYLLS